MNVIERHGREMQPELVILSNAKDLALGCLDEAGAEARSFATLRMTRLGPGVRDAHGWLPRKASSCARRTLPRLMQRYVQPPRVQARSSRSRGCAAKHADGYRDTVY